MKKMKKIVSMILVIALLVTTCITDGFGAFAAEGETDVEVTKLYSGHNATILTFALSSSDYGAETKEVNDTHTQYNYWSNIKIHTSDKIYTLGEAYEGQKYYAMWGRQNTVSIQLKKDIYDTVTKIEIPEGTVFPSKGYTNDASGVKGGYVTTKAVLFLRPSATIAAETNWIKTIPSTDVTTHVTKIHVRAGKILLFLDTHDYTGVTGTTPITKEKMKEYNLLDNIYVYKSDTEYQSLADVVAGAGATGEKYYNIWDETGSVAFDMMDGWDATTIKKVVIKKGCQFPAYAYTDNASVEKTAYVTGQEVTFTTTPTTSTDNTIWSRSASTTKVDTGVVKIAVRSEENQGGKLLIYPTVNDYAAAGSTTTVKTLTGYNTLDSILIYTSETEYKKLSEIYGGEKYYNVWGEKESVALSMTQAYNGKTVKKVVIKKGCQLPSYQYTNNNGLDNNAYTVTEDMVYVTNTSNVFNVDWTLKDESVPTEVSVLGVQNRNEKILEFTLSSSDYEIVKANTSMNDAKVFDYNFWTNIKIYTGATEYQTLQSAYTSGKQKYYRMWEAADTVGVELNQEVHEAMTKIEIPAGTVFPSASYTETSSYQKFGFKTTQSVTYVKSGNEWTVYEAPKDKNTGVSKIHVRNGKLLVFLTEHDYAGVASTTNIGDKLAEYNIMDNIILSTATETKSLKEIVTNERYYNVWNETGSVAFGLATGWDGNTIKSVTFKKGCEFPMYEYTSSSATEKASYILSEEIRFATDKALDENMSWTETYEPINRETGVDKIQVRAASTTDTRILVFLTENDYADAAANTSWYSKHTEYNYKDKIVVTTDAGAVKLADILNVTGDFSLNTWSESGCVGIPLASAYNSSKITQISIPQGTEFPSYEYVSGGIKNFVSYVTTKDIVIKRQGDSDANYQWEKVNVTDIETEISGVSVASDGITFTLTENDYKVANGTVSDRHKEFNYWKNVRVYTDDTTYSNFENWGGACTVSYGNNTLKIAKDTTDIVRVVVPAGTLFPSYAYTSGQITELSGYKVLKEIVYEKQNGVWKDISVASVTNISGDVNGDGKADSKDVVAMAKYLKNGYRYNVYSLTYDENATKAENMSNVRQVLLGKTLHNYMKESKTMTYFSSSDRSMDSFLNNYFLRHIGYTDYKEGDLKVGSYAIGTWYEGIFNHNWNMEAISWMNTSDDFKVDRKENMKNFTSDVIVDDYGYVWDGTDRVEATTEDLSDSGSHKMGWPFPNAKGGYGTTSYWDFNGSKGSWSVTNAASSSVTNGVYNAVVNGQSSVSFSINGSSKLIDTAHAPYLAFDLRMSGVTGTIDDIYVYYTTTSKGNFTEDKKVSVKDLAPVQYNYTEAATSYAHMIYLPMYTQNGWYAKDEKQTYVYGIKIEIVGNNLSGNFGLNYVRPYYDTRYSDNNADYISSVREYYDATGDIEFLKANMTKVRKAIGFYKQMYDESMQLIDLSYMQGHDGDKENVYKGISNGYYDVLYTPVYDFSANMYFCKALENAAYLEEVLTTKGISIATSDATIKAPTERKKANGVTTVTYTDTSESLTSLANTVKDKIRSYFWDTTNQRFFAGYDNSNGKVDYGYLMWNLEAVEFGIADTSQTTFIISWVNGTRTIANEASTGADIYGFELAPRVTTGKGDSDIVQKNNIFSAYYKKALTNLTYRDFGEKQVQYGGANMYTSYYDLVNRVNYLSADNALERLNGIKTWYQKVQDSAERNGTTPFNFYEEYYKKNTNYVAQSGAHSGNGVIGIQGEFTESLLTLTAIPKGFFGVKQSGNVLTVEPSLPSTMDYWKIENMEFANVLYDLSIYDDAVRIDSVRGNTTELTVKVILDCKDGQKVYVDGVETSATVKDGKATVTVSLKDTIVEVK